MLCFWTAKQWSNLLKHSKKNPLDKLKALTFAPYMVESIIHNILCNKFLHSFSGIMSQV